MFLHGDFGLISPASLLQVLSQERRSVRMSAWRGASAAQIEMLDGLVVSARCNGLAGYEAALQIVAWDCGRFQVASLLDAPEQTEMAAEWEELLLEGARRRDELEIALAPLPPYPSRAEIDQLLRACPALGGVALVGCDGRLLGAVGIDEERAEAVAAMACELSAVGVGAGAQPGVSLFVRGAQRLLLAEQGDRLVLAMPGAGASIGDASSQLAAYLSAAATM
jgi:predicted regulator of Ras-like GTPase activity (Roadblock/LC7/MglB family)